jgi:citrate lyase beta subunit
MRLAGRMVERLHERQAKRLLAMAEQIKAMENETTGATKARR